MLVWLTLPFYDFCGFRSVAVNSVYKLQFFYIYIIIYAIHETIVRCSSVVQAAAPAINDFIAFCLEEKNVRWHLEYRIYLFQIQMILFLRDEVTGVPWYRSPYFMLTRLMHLFSTCVEIC